VNTQESAGLGRFTLKIAVILFWIATTGCFGQFYPEGAHVDLNFPHLADGGVPAQHWQTSFVFVNPNASVTAHVTLYIYGDSGQPLSLNLGAGAASVHRFTILPLGSRTLRSTIGTKTVTGYAFAATDTPLQGTALFRLITNGVPQVEAAAAATLPSIRYLSPATRDLGIALVNIDNGPRIFRIGAIDSNGSVLGSDTLTLGPFEHTSLNLSQLLPALPTAFSGSIQIDLVNTIPSDQFLAWTLNADRGLIAPLPPGRLEFPISQVDRIELVYQKLVAAAPGVLNAMGIKGVNLNAARLAISADPVINASASADGTVQIYLTLSELISDAPSELAAVVGHELGHIAQDQAGKPSLFLLNRELDADYFGMMLMLFSGFDPYAGAGALAKISTATGQAGLVAANFDDLVDPHLSFNTRIESMFSILQQLCSQPSNNNGCRQYQSFIHPDLPLTVPLLRKGGSADPLDRPQ